LTVFAQPFLDFTRQAARQLENMILHRPLETFGPSQAVLIERGSCMNYNPDIK
jgi:DNA-binding LacI/PurR family transcriptional regulator